MGDEIARGENSPDPGRRPMKREIIVNSSIVETRVAVLEDGVLVELLIDDSKNKSIAGNIYKGRVLKILPGMQAAFVDLGLAKDAFLYVRDIFEDVEEYEQLLTIGEDGESAEPLAEEPRSSFAVRVCASTLSDFHSCIVCGIGTI